MKKLVNEAIGDVLKPKGKDEILKSFEKYFKGPGFYCFTAEFDDSWEMRLEPLNSIDDFTDELDAIIETYNGHYNYLYIAKIDTSRPNLINKYDNGEWSFDQNAELITTLNGNY